MAERTFRTIFNDARSMLSSTTALDETHWPLALQHSILVRNLLPKGEKKLSAYEMLLGKQPNEILKRLHVFGSKVYIHVKDKGRKKMDFNAIEGM